MKKKKSICKTLDDGTKEWRLNGERHRTDGPAIERLDGTKKWYLNGERHRTDGPAIEWPDGEKEWYLNGELHRTDGPAVEWSDGEKEWYLNDKKYLEINYWKELYNQGIITKEELFIKML